MRCLTAKARFVALILLASMGCGACTSGGGDGGGADHDASVPDDGNGSDPTADGPGVLIGRVVQVDGEPLAGAAVTLDNGRSASTDDNGFYSFPELNVGDEVIAAFRKPGYTPTAKAMTVTPHDAAPLIAVVITCGIFPKSIQANSLQKHCQYWTLPSSISTRPVTGPLLA